MSAADVMQRDFDRTHDTLTPQERENYLAAIASQRTDEDAWTSDRANCPTWCDDHRVIGYHSREVTVGQRSVSIEQADAPDDHDLVGAYVVVNGRRDEVEQDQLRDLIAALTEAQRLIASVSVVDREPTRWEYHLNGLGNRLGITLDKFYDAANKPIARLTGDGYRSLSDLYRWSYERGVEAETRRRALARR